jgi:hypothetical protein
VKVIQKTSVTVELTANELSYLTALVGEQSEFAAKQLGLKDTTNKNLYEELQAAAK